MNNEQIICLWAGIVGAVASGIFPPWTAGGCFAGYRYLWWQPLEGAPKIEPPLRIDLVRLVIQWAMVAAVTVGLILTFSSHGKLTNFAIPG